MNIEHNISATILEDELRDIIKQHCKKLYNAEPIEITFNIADMTENQGEDEKVLTHLEFDQKDVSKFLLDKIKPIKVKDKNPTPIQEPDTIKK